MEELSKKRKKKFQPEIVTERSLPSGEKYKNKKYKSSVFNEKRNPLSFVVPWQLSDE